jgi:hypothetical protein
MGGGGGVPADFFLRQARKFPIFPVDILEISWKFRNCPFSRPEENSALGLCKVAIQSLVKLFRSKQGVIPGSEPQNYDDSLRKQKFLLQCRKKFHVTTQIVLLCGTHPAPGIKGLKALLCKGSKAAQIS